MKICSVLLFAALTSISGFGQEAKASMSPNEVAAGKNITITLTVDKVPSIQGATLSVILAPKDPKDNPGSYGVNLIRDNDSNVYSNTTQVPPNARGVWYIREASTSLPVVGGSTPIDTNHPEFTIKPIEITLPKTGKVGITTP